MTGYTVKDDSYRVNLLVSLWAADAHFMNGNCVRLRLRPRFMAANDRSDGTAICVKSEGLRSVNLR